MSYKFPKFSSGNKAFAKALNDVVSVLRLHGVNPGGRPGWVETENGWMPPFVSPDRIAGSTIWNLDVTNAENNEVMINVGTIIKDVADLTDAATIVDGGTAFNVAATDLAWLKVETPASPIVTLEHGSPWTSYPKAFSVTGSGGTAEFEAFYYPLYAFVDTSTDETTPISEGIHALRLIGNHHLAIINSIFQSGADRPIQGLSLIPYHRVLP